MAITTLRMDKDTERAIQELQKHFNSPTKADVFRKALALLKLARDIQEKGGSIATLDKEDRVQRVLIS